MKNIKLPKSCKNLIIEYLLDQCKLKGENYKKGVFIDENNDICMVHGVSITFDLDPCIIKMTDDCPAEFPLELLSPGSKKEFRTFLWSPSGLMEVIDADYVTVPTFKFNDREAAVDSVGNFLEKNNLKLKKSRHGHTKDSFVQVERENGEFGLAVLAAVPRE